MCVQLISVPSVHDVLDARSAPVVAGGTSTTRIVVCKEQSLGAYALYCARVFDDTPDMLFIEVSNHTPV